MEISRYELLRYLAQLIELDESLTRVNGNAPKQIGTEEAQEAIRREVVLVLKEVPGALSGPVGRRRTRLESWFLLFRPRSVAAWALHLLFYALCVITPLLAFEFGYSAFMGTLFADLGPPTTKLGESFDVFAVLTFLTALTIGISLLARKLDEVKPRVSQPNTVRKMFLWYWPPTFVSGFAQLMFYWLLLAEVLSPIYPRPSWVVPLGRFESATLNSCFALTILACYFLARSQLRPLERGSRVLSSGWGLLLLDIPRGASSWFATSSVVLQMLFFAVTVTWLVSGSLPFEVLLTIPPFLLITYVWALEERRRPAAGNGNGRDAQAPVPPVGGV